ncbi:hypothetical protein AURDEDRAFT_154261 [Auricularia subglabra TFB-10046 SS5]|nr:hypothetical protein AURDEDRAFT_154261 [Auricularia subglabra TFB-10046 SS5]
MALNDDILYMVVRYSDRQTLATLCSVSRAMRGQATMLLYRSVRVRTLDELGALDNALALNDSLAPLVLEFFQDLSRDPVPPWNDPEALPWLQQFNRRFDAPILRIIPRLVDLEAIALEEVSPARDYTMSRLVERLAELLRLRSVRLPRIGAANLVQLHLRAPLEHIYIKERSPDGISDWLLRHAGTLRTLRIDNSGLLFRRLTRPSRTGIFPYLHTLILQTERLSLPANCGAIFPALRSLTILRPERDLPNLWPQLQHLSFTLDDEDPIAPLPYVASLQVTYTSTDYRKLSQLHKWSAHHERALLLSCRNVGFNAHVEALRMYTGLRMFDVRLPSIDSEAAAWLRRAATTLPVNVVPPSWEILTLRNAAGVDTLTQGDIDAIRVRAPSLKLVRVISADLKQRRLYGWPAPINWRAACEIVADYLPHWRETRVPWDDVYDI